MGLSRHPGFVLSLIGCLILAEGCRVRQSSAFKSCGDDCYTAIATQVEYPVVTPCSTFDDQWAAAGPITLATLEQADYWNMTLEEAVRVALADSQVIRDLGGAVLRTPANAETHWDPALVETDPRLGVEAALSAFDAELTASAFGEKNDLCAEQRVLRRGHAIAGSGRHRRAVANRQAIGGRLAVRHSALHRLRFQQRAEQPVPQRLQHAV